jgi:hypothetical protein
VVALPWQRDWRRLLVIATLAAAIPAHSSAQSAPLTRTLTACTPGALAACAELRLTAGPSLFELALRTVGAAGEPGLPVSVYNLVLGTGTAAAGAPVTTLLAPAAEGGAVVRDASPWEVFDAGEALFLTALTNRGVGGCAAGADVRGFGQAVTTCGAGQFAVFRFAPTATFGPDAFTILNFEIVALADPLRAASCGAPSAACVITADTRPVSTIPEPETVALMGVGLLAAVAADATRRRRV